MLRQFLVGAAASGCNIAIHALVMVTVIKVARLADELATAYQTVRLIAIMIAAVTVLMIAHLAEVLVWTLTYAAVDVAPEGTDLMYFAFVNYTTLGYGDVVPRTDVARGVTVLEAVAGQLYVAVTIARLVGARLAAPGRRP